MAFDNVTFPDVPMKHGTRPDVIDQVKVITNGTKEYRVRRQSYEKFKWTIPAQTMTNDQKESVRTFLSQRNHGLNSFKFVDPNASAFDDSILAHNSSTYWNLMLPIDDSTPGSNHPIFNPVVGELSVTVDTVPDTIDSFSILNGVPVISILGTSGSEVVRVTGTIYFTVRLHSAFSSALVAMDINDNPIGHQVNAIQLMEVYDEY